VDTGLGGGAVRVLAEAAQDETKPDTGDHRVLDGRPVLGSHGDSVADAEVSANVIHTIEQYLRLMFSLKLDPMSSTWRPSRLHPDRIHLLAEDGRGRCGATVALPPPEPTRCALCVLLAEDAEAADDG